MSKLREVSVSPAIRLSTGTISSLSRCISIHPIYTHFKFVHKKLGEKHKKIKISLAWGGKFGGSIKAKAQCKNKAWCMLGMWLKHPLMRPLHWRDENIRPVRWKDAETNTTVIHPLCFLHCFSGWDSFRYNIYVTRSIFCKNSGAGQIKKWIS